MAENQTDQQDDNALSTRIAQKADNLKYFLLAAVVILAAVVGIVLYMGSTRAKERAAASDNAFRSFVALQGKTPAEAAPELIKTAKELAGQPAGIQVAVHAFGASMDAKQYAEAEAVGQEFLRNYPDSELAPRMKVAIAQAQLWQGGKTQAVIDGLRAFTATATPETLPEAKLALAQALEQFAEEAKDNPEEYASRLEAAEAEYTDITSRARIDMQQQRTFWPQMVTLTADFALVQIKDRLAGHELPEPVVPAVTPAPDAAVTPDELEAVESLRPPGAAAAPEAAPAPEEPAPAAEAEPEEPFGPAARLGERAGAEAAPEAETEN